MEKRIGVFPNPKQLAPELLSAHLELLDCPFDVVIREGKCKPLEPLVLNDVRLKDSGDGFFEFELTPEQAEQLKEFLEAEKIYAS